MKSEQEYKVYSVTYINKQDKEVTYEVNCCNFKVLQSYLRLEVRKSDNPIHEEI